MFRTKKYSIFDSRLINRPKKPESEEKTPKKRNKFQK